MLMLLAAAEGSAAPPAGDLPAPVLTPRPASAAVSRSDPAANSLALFQKQAAALHAGFAARLEELAGKCAARGQTVEAEEIRRIAAPPDRARLRRHKPPGEVQPEVPRDLPPDERSWRVQLRFEREKYAKELYLLSRRALRAGHVQFAYELVHEVIAQHPDHSGARSILGYVRHGDAWVTPYVDQMLRQKRVLTEKYGWLPRDHVARYENGERMLNGRWVSAAQEAEVRRDFRQAWQVRTEHFLIKTNHSLEKGVELGRLLEDYFGIFFETFAQFFQSPEEMRKLFEGGSSRPVVQKPYEVHFFRTRDEYMEALRGKTLQPIEITTGMYLTAERTAFFFDDPQRTDDLRTTLIHEATHLLLSEARYLRTHVGERSDFWAVEGIACYMESFERDGGETSLGNPEYVRFRAARHRAVVDDYYVPLAEFTAMGMVEFQSSPNISKNYSQAAGLVHFFVHFNDGAYRTAFGEYLSDLYSLDPRVRQRPRRLDELTGVPFAELDRQYRAYMETLPTAPAVRSSSQAPARGLSARPGTAA